MGVVNKVIAAGAVAVVAYMFVGLRQMYNFINPLHGVEVVGPAIEPLWPEGQKFDFFAFLSTKNRLASIDPSLLRSNASVVIERRGLMHSSAMQEQRLTETIDLQSVSKSSEKWVQDIADQVHGNGSSVFLHVILYRARASSEERKALTRDRSLSSIVGDRGLFSTGDALHGAVRLIKYDVIPGSFHHKYLLSDFNLVELTEEEKRKMALPKSTVISFWKPEVSVKLVSDFQRYPYGHLHRNVLQTDKSKLLYKPALYVDEIGLTIDKYLPLFSPMQNLSLTVSLGPMSSQRWLFMSQVEPALREQTGFGLTERDIDDVRRAIADTSLFALTAMIAVTILHTIFDFLAFRSDINFWKQQDKHVGISLRSLVWSLVSQIVILAYLITNEASLLIVVSVLCGMVIQIWKTKKAWGIALSLRLADLATYVSAPLTPSIALEPPPPLPSTKLADSAAQLVVPQPSSQEVTSSKAETADANEDILRKLEQVSSEADAFAYKYVGLTLAPIICIFILRSLIYEKHSDWFKFIINGMAGCEYTFGFVLMIPQLYINHRLQSVSHLPWNFLAYKFVNTFIDDVFAFVIKMPTAHRIAVFRDDVVFLIYLYQRYIYRVDRNRPVEK